MTTTSLLKGNYDNFAQAYILVSCVQKSDMISTETLVILLEDNGIIHRQINQSFYPVDSEEDVDSSLLNSIKLKELSLCKNRIQNMLCQVAPEHVLKEIKKKNTIMFTDDGSIYLRTILGEIRHELSKLVDILINENLRDSIKPLHYYKNLEKIRFSKNRII